ncbi:MAG TPA: single-stranded DNA-binding protein [Bryobacteraceae bacterium]
MSNGSTPITIVGNLTGDPELRFTAQGVAVANFSVAVNRKTFNQGTKRWEDSGTDFHRVTVWRSLAENATESLKRGDRVIVQGTLESNQYETREGEKRITWEITGYAVGPDLMFATADVTRVEVKKDAKGSRR